MPGREADHCFALSSPCVLSFPTAKFLLKREFHAAQHRTGLQMPFPGFQPYNWCRNPVAVHASGPRAGIFYQTCCIFRDQIPAGNLSLAVPLPCSPWVFYCEPRAFCKATAILYRPEILCGGRSPSPPWNVTPSSLPGVSSRSFFPVNRCSCVTALSLSRCK